MSPGERKARFGSAIGRRKREKLRNKQVSKDDRVSPGQSMAVSGNVGLAGLSQRRLEDALRAGRQNTRGTEYTGDLADFMNRKNLEIAQNEARVAGELRTDPSKRGFRGFLPRYEGGLGQFFGDLGRGLTNLTSQITPERLMGTIAGTALGLGPIGSLITGQIAGTYGDDDPSNNFFGNMGRSLQKDFGDTINFLEMNDQDQREEFINYLSRFGLDR